MFDLYGTVFALIILVSITVNLLVVVASTVQNRQSEDTERHTLETILNTRFEMLDAEARDNGIWAEGFQNLVVRRDLDWARAVYNESFYRNFGIEAMFLLNASNQPLIALQRGEPMSAGDIQSYLSSADAREILVRAQAVRQDQPVPVHGYFSAADKLYIATAVRISPEKPPYPKRSAQDVVLLLLSPVDPAYLAAIEHDYGITALRLTAPTAANLLSLTALSGSVPAALIWMPHRPGDAFLFMVLPPILLASLLILVISFLAIRKLRSNLCEIKTALAAAAAASHAKSAFLASISHELRTPLNAVIGFSDIMAKQALGPLGAPSYLEFAETIRASGNHLLLLIDDVLDLNSLDQRSLTLNDSKIDLAELVTQCVGIMTSEAAAAEIALQIHLPDALPPVRADQRRLRQILLHLLSNAIKFNRTGGTVTITAQRQDCRLKLTISDTGIGMDVADIPVALERFGQVDSTMTRTYTGSGLGLPLARELTELHGGDLTIESMRNVGTRVTITFPADRVLPQADPF